MEEEACDPLEINKDPEVIKGAQNEIGDLDVLVCGICHNVYHFIEQFQEHKQEGQCSGSSSIKENYKHEPKPQVWAFMLWKNAQFKHIKNDEPPPSSWTVYQRWCKLDPDKKDAWITAGRNIQTFSKISTAKLQEQKNDNLVTVPSLTLTKSTNNDDPLEEGEIRLSLLSESQRKALKAQTEANKVSDDADPLGGTEMEPKESQAEDGNQNDDKSKTNNAIKKGIVKPVQLNSDVTILPSNKCGKRFKMTSTSPSKQKISKHDPNCYVYDCHSKKQKDIKVHFHRFPPKDTDIVVTVKNKLVIEEKVSKARKNTLLMGNKVTNAKRVSSKRLKNEDYCSKGAQLKQPKLRKQVLPSVKLPKQRYRKTRKHLSSRQQRLIQRELRKAQQQNKGVTNSRVQKSVRPLPKKVQTEKKGGNTKRGLRTDRNVDKKEEYVVEKIVSKRYNPRKKTFEYLIKWENFDSNQNTWEPPAHLQSCQNMVQDFEKYLQKQKLEKAKAAIQQKQLEKKLGKTNVPTMTRGRPQRTSKQKALNQVKAWCGDISDADESSGKRKFADDDSDSDSFDKKMKLEYSDDSSDEDVSPKSTLTVKKVTKPASVNGVGKKPLPENILIPDAKGIVRINQKQAAELSSGVYIMSKTAGIIKLDSDTSKLAASGGQTIVKVAPKIGQTQIKVVKKDPSSNLIRLTPKLSPKSKPAKQSTPKVTAKPVTKKEEKKPVKVVVAEKVEAPEEDDESDGIPELEFPKDLPLPEPESPPGEFILDPETGKVVGQDYPEEKEVEINTPEKSSNLENLVNLAAADIINDEMQKSENGISENVDPTPQEENKPEEKTNEAPVTETTEQPKPEEKKEVNKNVNIISIENTTPKIKKETPKPIIRTKIISTSKPVTNSESSILQRKLLSSPNVVRQPPKLNRSPNPQTYSSRNNSITKRVISPKGKVGIPQTTPTITRVRQSNKQNMSVARKIGQTTIYRKSPALQPKRVEQAPITLNTEMATANTIIHMPLVAQEEPSQTEFVSPLTVPETITDLSSLTELNEPETSLIITGEDGTIYEVAGQNEQGETILISQGADGQQQCLVVATESLQLEAQQQQQLQAAESVQEPVAVAEMPEVAEESTEETQVVAQLISADPPSPGGKRNVTVMLPDGSQVTMSVTPEQYESLELDM